MSDSLSSRNYSTSSSDFENDLEMLLLSSSHDSSDISESEEQSHEQVSEEDESVDIVECPEVYAQFEGMLEAPCGRRYGIGKRLGSGGFGTVRLAYSFDDRKYYAMKEIGNKTKDDKRNVAREVSSMNVLKTETIYTDHIVRYVDFFEEHEKFYLVMEKMNLDLSYLRKKFNAPMSVSFIRLLAKQILTGLKDIHDAGYVHGDMKLANVMISEHDDEFIVKIIDLGLMTSASELLSRRGTQYGTKEYWAPEMILGLPLNSKLDIWAAGVMLFELYTGNRLFLAKEPVEMLAAITKIVGLPGYPQTGKHFKKMFLNEKSPDGRFQWIDKQIPCGLHSWYGHRGFKDLHKYGRNGKDVDPQFENLDFKFQELLRGMMYPSAVYRLSARQALAHDFFRED